MKKYKSVRTKLILVIFLAVLTTAILCIGVNVYNFSKYYREAIDGKINASAQSVIKTINEILKSGSLGSSGVITEWIGRDCERAKTSDKDILYLAVTDTKGLIHYHTEKQYMNKTFEQPKNVIDKAYPIKPDGGDSAGILHIGIEKKTINNKINAFIFGGVLISVFILCLILPLVSLLVSNRIMKPLKKITVMLTDIAEGDGDLTKRLERVETQDEFEVLSKKFNKFVDKVHELVVKVGQNTSNVSRSANELYAKTEEMKDVIV
ncbi:MAG: HAMP domain-containing protein, partial [Proteobacteria bacterium]|nr:HAMP domain-containing protein [Pseudomonadota bacterium]